MTRARILSEIVTAESLTAAGIITTNNYEVNLLTGNVKQIATAPTGTFAVYVSNVPTTDGHAITFTMMVTQGATGYIPGWIYINNTLTTIKWAGATAPTPTSAAGYVDIFSFTILRMAGAWTLYGSMLAKF